MFTKKINLILSFIPRSGFLNISLGRKSLFFLLLIFFIFPEVSDAQCAMCRAVVESEADGKTAEGINNGIVYLMAIPYILVAGLFFFIYKKMKG